MQLIVFLIFPQVLTPMSSAAAAAVAQQQVNVVDVAQRIDATEQE